MRTRQPDPVAQLRTDYSELIVAAQNWQLPLPRQEGSPSCVLAYRGWRTLAIEFARLPDPRPLLRLLRCVGALDRASFCLKVAVIRSLPESLRLELAALESLLLNEYTNRKNTQPATLSPQSHREYLGLRWGLDFIADPRWGATGHLVSSVVKEDWHKSLWALHRWKLRPRTDWDGWCEMIKIHPQGLTDLTLDLAIVIDEDKASFLASCTRLKTLRFAVDAGQKGEQKPDLAWLDRLAQLKRLVLPASVALSRVPPATLSRLSLLALTAVDDPHEQQSIPSALPQAAQLQLVLGAEQSLPVLQGQLSALSVHKLEREVSQSLPQSLVRLEVLDVDRNVKSPLLELKHLSELVLGGNFQQLVYLNNVLAAPNCKLRVLCMRRLPTGEHQLGLLNALHSNRSLEELSLDSLHGLNAANRNIIPTLAAMIRAHPRLQKLSVRLGKLYTNNDAITTVLEAIRANRRLLWVKLDLMKETTLSAHEEFKILDQLQALMPASRHLLRFEYSLGSHREQLGNWRY